MEILTVDYKRFTPSESVGKLKNKKSGRLFYRHRYTILNKNTRKQEYKDYKINKFDSFDDFVEFIEEKPRYKNQIIV